MITISILFCITSCAQKGDPQKVYSDISKAFCGCVNKDTLRSSIQIADSCLKASLNQYYSSIQQEGLDSSSSNPSFYKELTKNIKINCPEYKDRLAREVRQAWELENKNIQEEQKTTYSGSFVSQYKLPNGEYEIIVKSRIGHLSRTFISSKPVIENEAKIQGVEISIKFEPNTSSLKAKYQFRVTNITVVRAIEVGNQ